LAKPDPRPRRIFRELYPGRSEKLPAGTAGSSTLAHLLLFRPNKIRAARSSRPQLRIANAICYNNKTAMRHIK
jgi:hypothetical protein